MSDRPWRDILRESIEDGGNIPDKVAQSFIKELLLVKAMHNGTDVEIAEAEYQVLLVEGGTVH